jgi:hypothetical protein
MGGGKAPLKRRDPIQTGVITINLVKDEVREVDTGIYRHEERIHPDAADTGAKFFAPDDAPGSVEFVDELLDELEAVLRSADERCDNETLEHWVGVAKARLKNVRHILDSDPGQQSTVRMAYLAGLAVERATVCAKEHYALMGKKEIARRARSGRATRKLTKEQERLVCEMMQQEIKPGVSITAASLRVAGKLQANGLPAVSDDTIRRVWKAAQR